MMEKATVKDLYELMTEHNLSPAAEFKFSVGHRSVAPKDIEIVGCQESRGGYHSHPGFILIKISDEYIDEQVKHRMKEMFAQHVDAMFAPAN